VRGSVAKLVPAFALVGACAHAPLLCPAHGGPPWFELASTHFVARTDLPRADAETAILAFERDHDALAQAAFSFKEGLPGRSEVVLFASAGELSSFTRMAGLFREGPSGLGRRPTLIMKGALDPTSRLIFRHELTHRFVRHYYRQAPTWFNEGLADYYSIFELHEQEVKVGLPSPIRGFTQSGAYEPVEDQFTYPGAMRTPISKLPAVSELLDGGRAFFYSGHAADHYAGAWGLVHMLISEPDRYRPGFAELMVAMSRGDSFARAFERAYPGVDRGQLEADFREYVRRDSTYAYRIAIAPHPIGPIAIRELSDAEVHLLWAEIRAWSGPEAMARVGWDLDQALESTPTSSEALALHGLWLEAEGRKIEAQAELDRAQVAAPLALFLLRNPDPSHVAMLSTLIPRLALSEDAESLEIAARLLRSTGRPGEGLPLAQRALDLDPGCVSCIDTLAELEWIAGDRSRAIEAEALAVEIAPEGIDTAGMRARVATWRAQLKSE
jgi:hypothetical protein